MKILIQKQTTVTESMVASRVSGDSIKTKLGVQFHLLASFFPFKYRQYMNIFIQKQTTVTAGMVASWVSGDCIKTKLGVLFHLLASFFFYQI